MGRGVVSCLVDTLNFVIVTGLPETPLNAIHFYTRSVKGMSTVRGGIVPWLTAAVGKDWPGLGNKVSLRYCQDESSRIPKAVVMLSNARHMLWADRSHRTLNE